MTHRPIRVSLTGPRARVWPLAVAALLLIGCGSSSSKDEPVQTYTVRGQVKVLPGERPELEIHHEAIPTFVGMDGQKVGMKAMVMPFGLADGLALNGVAVGDKIEFTLAVDWQRTPSGYLTALRKLPASTALKLDR